MPLAFKLPTTSFLALQDYLSSSTHPSLPVSATSHRSVARQALKNHKRLPKNSKSGHLSSVLAALDQYVPFLLALDAGLGGKNVAGDEVQVDLEREVQVEWRPTLIAAAGGREPARVKLRSLEYEVLFTLSTLATTNYLIARSHLHSLYNIVTPSEQQRTAAVSTAAKHFTEASAIFNALMNRASQLTETPPVPEIAWNSFEAMAAISCAETILAAVLKDDPYPKAVVQSRNQNDNEWMYKAPSLPKVRAHLFARLCIAASEHASKAQSTLSGLKGISSSLVSYTDDLKRTSRGKACRFLAIDAELASKTGEGIAWLHAALAELGFTGSITNDTKVKGTFSKIKKEWTEKREDRKVDKGDDWGGDAGKFEEGRVIEQLVGDWTRMNNTVNCQVIPPWEPLLAKLPSGREYDTAKPWVPPSLDENTLAQMRALPDLEAVAATRVVDDDSDDDQLDGPRPMVGAFPESENGQFRNNNYY